MDDISSQDEAVRTLKKSIQEGNVSISGKSHLSASSSSSLWTSGNGKDISNSGIGTGTLWVDLCELRIINSPEMRDRVLELNASDERGIDV